VRRALLFTIVGTIVVRRSPVVTAPEEQAR
jgi:hypothetical protein